MAGRAEVITAVARKKNAHVHLISALLQPAEKTFYAIPRPRPFEVVFPITGLAVDHKITLLGRERAKGDVGRDFLSFGDALQVVLGRAVDFAFPAFDRTVVDRERRVRNGEAVVDFDDAAKTFAVRAGAER